MSLDCTRWAWSQCLKPTDKLVLLSLADRANEYHQCFPSQKRLHVDTGLDRKTIIACLNRLKISGLIADTGERKGRTKQIVVWQLIGVEGREEYQKRNSTKNGTVPEFPPKSPKNGTGKESQKRDTESTSYNHSEESTPPNNKITLDWRPDIDVAKRVADNTNIPLDFVWFTCIPKFAAHHAGEIMDDPISRLQKWVADEGLMAKRKGALT